MTSWSPSTSKFGFYQLIECIIKKICHDVKQNVPLVKQNVMKFEVFILGGQRIDQKRRNGGEGACLTCNININFPLS